VWLIARDGFVDDDLLTEHTRQKYQARPYRLRVKPLDGANGGKHGDRHGGLLPGTELWDLLHAAVCARPGPLPTPGTEPLKHGRYIKGWHPVSLPSLAIATLFVQSIRNVENILDFCVLRS